MTRTDLIEAIAQETGTDRQQAKAFLEESHAPYLVKPFHAAAIRRVVQQALQRLEAL